MWWRQSCWPFGPLELIAVGLTELKFVGLSVVFSFLSLLFSHSVTSDFFYNSMGASPPGSLCPWDFPGKITGVGCHFLSRGSSPPRDRPTSLNLLFCRWILYGWVTWEALEFRVFSCRAMDVKLNCKDILVKAASQVVLVIRTHLSMQET